jgi:hypothetical protein
MIDRKQPDRWSIGSVARLMEEVAVERYTCPRELIPVIESALAAEGYVVEVPLQRAVGSTRVTVMTRGTAMISLHEDVTRDMADINVYRNEAGGALEVFNELPRLFGSAPTPRR